MSSYPLTAPTIPFANFLQNKEEDARRKRTDEYSEHKHTVINAVAAGEVCNQHRHGLGGIIHHNNLWP